MIIQGTLISAGIIDIDGEPRTGMFIETTGGTVAEMYRQGMYNKFVTVSLSDRRKKSRKGEVTFHELRKP